MHLKSVHFMTPGLFNLLERLNSFGHEAFMVGGCVRDVIIGRSVSDVDLATSATPEEVKQILGNSPSIFTLYPTGVEHGTWTVEVGGDTYEVTSYRKDVATDGRRAVVEFSRCVYDDAYRRDFTMNALYMSADGTVKDPSGDGIHDLMARRVRFVGDAGKRCREDYLRILRLFRFYAHLGNGPMDETALTAAELNAGGLRAVSGERVWAELKKILAAADPSLTLEYMNRSGVLGQVFRGHKVDVETTRNVVVAELVGGYEPNWTRRYAALAGRTAGVPFPASKAEKRHQDRVRVEWQRADDARATAYRTKDGDITIDAYLLNRAAVNPRTSVNVHHDVVAGLSAEMPLTATMLMDAGVPEGPELGDKLRRAEELFVTSGFQATAPALFRHAV